MENTRQEPKSRRILAGTLHGTVEGNLHVASSLRTLDFLNRSAALLVTLHDATVVSTRWQPECRTVSVSAASILWIAEIEVMRSPSARRQAAVQNRSAVRLCMPDYEIRGFLHIPAAGDPIVRLNQDRAPFFAMTSASVVGEDNAFAAAFLAVNRTHIFAAETLEPEGDEAFLEAPLASDDAELVVR